MEIHFKRAAVAFDVTAETTDRSSNATSDEVLGDLAGKLLPKKKPNAGSGKSDS